MRDRATLYLSLLTDEPETVQEDAQAFLFQSLDVPLENLETSLQSFVSISIIYCHQILSSILLRCSVQLTHMKLAVVFRAEPRILNFAVQQR